MLRTRRPFDRIAMATVLASLIMATPSIRTAAVTDQSRPVSLVLPAQSGCQVAGPFPTLRRAHEVAAEARRGGYSAVAYHAGDGYYVRAC